MLRYGSDASGEVEWREVSFAHPGPVCEATTGCTLLEDGAFIRCVTTISERPLLTGGWLHHLTGVEADNLVVATPSGGAEVRGVGLCHVTFCSAR